MKLYQFFASPFPTRVRLMLYAKGIPFEIVEPPGFGNSKLPKGEYLKLNPLGRVPTLVLDDGRALPESEVICEYLEETFPSPPLLPADPWQRAQVRLVTRISDIYLVMAMVPLFDLLATKRSQWNRAVIDAAADKVAEALAALEVYIGINGYAVGPSLTVAVGRSRRCSFSPKSGRPRYSARRHRCTGFRNSRHTGAACGPIRS
jgi:glutathione S-transferase